MHLRRSIILIVLTLGSLHASAFAQNPVPFVHQPLVPTAIAPGGPGFTLTVNGAGFVPESVVQWNGSPRPTTFVSNTQLTAAIPAADIATIGSASITVFNPAPGGVSNAVLFLTTFPTSSVTFKQTDFGTNARAYGVAGADFNRDGKTDLAALRDSEILMFLGNGDGTFENVEEKQLRRLGAGRRRAPTRSPFEAPRQPVPAPWIARYGTNWFEALSLLPAQLTNG